MTKTVELPPLPDRFESLILRVLTAQSTLTEYQLMQQLFAEGLVEFAPDLDPLKMFRAHFLLFHLLYRLQDQWWRDGHGYLSIHTLDIHLQQRSLSDVDVEKALGGLGQAMVEEDLVKAYYLDYSAFLTTQQEDVLALLDDFWQRMTDEMSGAGIPGTSGPIIQQGERQAAQKTMGLEGQSLSQQKVKRQFRVLCQQHHPDKGGDAVIFRRIYDAKTLLLRSLK